MGASEMTTLLHGREKWRRRWQAACRALVVVAGLGVLLGMPAAHADKLPRLVLSGPLAAVSFPLIHMAESGALADIADDVVFVPWRDPDQLRLMALEGQADVLAMPTNVAANLYTRGAALKLVNVSTWGILWLVSRNAEVRTLADLKGAEIAMPFRADMPDIVFGVVARAQGLNPRSDFKLRYVASPMDAVQLLLARRVDHALLAEPAVSMALRKSQSFPLKVVAPDLYRAIDLQAEWGRALGRSARIPQAGIAVMGRLRDDAAFVARVDAAYRASLQWCQARPEDCGKLVAARIDLLDADAVADAVKVSPLEAVSVDQAREALQFFFDTLLQGNPAILGGRLPDAAFYQLPAP